MAKAFDSDKAQDNGRKEQFQEKSMSFLDDLARMAGGVVNVASTLRGQIQEDVKVRVEEVAARMDLVPRQDLDDANTRITALVEKVDALEKRVNTLDKKTPAKKK